MRVKAVFTTAYWPPVAYFSILYPSGEWILEQHETYQKQTLRNRCSICGANGPQWLIIPVVRKHGLKTPIREVMLDLSKDWQRNHWLAIESAYGSSPYYEYYREEIRHFYELKKTVPLFEFNTAILKWCFEILEISTIIKFTESYLQDYGDCDYRRCLPVYDPQPYYQVFARKHGFVPGQSILDLIMNEGSEAWKILKTNSKSKYDPQTR
ncbi:MAG: WbqC family protein [Bacteroidales bacterium]|nr:WbqC family protein [Bacteroidales bacterium]MDD2264763.1 WbqC family protein [Bacteroidales bacterium]MDD2831861.1 WbqC family protein [Bacteroidales bacterium]MDD3209140.1 WbqC family protein [Bacteroidales bacterium]MDD3697984.1 WbqC family protein [Bacteroidales bacterium]